MANTGVGTVLKRLAGCLAPLALLLMLGTPARAQHARADGGALTPFAAVQQVLFLVAVAIVAAVGVLAVLSGRKPEPPEDDLDPHGHGTGWGDGPGAPRRPGPRVF